MSSESKPIPLREWAERAVEAVEIPSLSNNETIMSPEIRKPLAISSYLYLSSALEVARSLADQACQVGDFHDNNNEEDGKDGDGGQQQRFQLPIPGPHWADQIVVHLSEKNEYTEENFEDYEGGDLQPLPFDNPGTDPRELQAMLNSLIPDHSLYTKEDLPGEEGMVSYHDVDRAEFIIPGSQSNDITCNNDEMKNIYSLGIVFYQLFSGGEIPLGISQMDTKNEPLGEGIVNGSTSLNNNQAGASLNVAGGLNIRDSETDTSLADSTSNNGEHNISMSNKRRSTQLGTTSVSVSIESLQLKGVPSSICNLIGNMVDCINEELRGGEAYLSMSDVLCDLQLMLDKPHRFIYDLDVDRLSVTGLQLNDELLGREKELSTLQSSYRRSISSENECGVIVGSSGIGKSTLALRLGSYISSNGGLFLSGKFDQLQQPKPFSALASAFNEYCNKMTCEGQPDQLQEVASKLRLVLGRDAQHLVKVIPNLSIILGEGSAEESEDDCVDAQKRLQYLLCQFVNVISSSSGAPIVLFLDDVQWADLASITVIKQLLMVSGSKKRQFYFLASCREEGLAEGHDFQKMISTISQFSIKATVVPLTCMDNEMVNTMVSELLCLSPRITRTLSDIIHHKTKGNPLFFSQLILSFYRNGWIWLSLSRRRWEWDIEKIQSAKLPDDIAQFLSSTIERFPKKVQDALFTLSCFGSRTSSALIEAVEAKLGSPLIESLEVAVSESLLDKIDGYYIFGHDWIQETSYNTVQAVDRCLFHFKYGIALVSQALDLQDNGLLFTAASQINMGGPASVDNVEQNFQVATLNLEAGKKAMEMSDFSSAFTYFDYGISFLRKGHWKEHYDLSLHLFESASKCALVISDHVSLELLSEQIQAYAKSFEDKLNSIYYSVTALAYAGRLPESVNRSILVLSQLGEEMPESYSVSEMTSYIEQTKSMLEGYTDDQLLEYDLMEDTSKLFAMKFYARNIVSFQMIKPEMYPIVPLKMVQLSIAHGMSPFSCVGLVYFGQIIGSMGYIRDGCRYAHLARKLYDRIGTKEVAGDVISMSTQMMCFIEPLQATIESHLQGQTIALAAGDTNGASLNSLLYNSTLFHSGTKLQVCMEQHDRTLRLVDKHGHFHYRLAVSEMGKWFVALIGLTEETGMLNGTDFHAAQAQDILKSNTHISLAFSFQNMYVSFMIRSYDETRAFAEGYFYALAKHDRWYLYYFHAGQSFYGGLVSFWIYRQTNDTKWAERGRESKLTMNKWAETASQHNFQHKAYLLEAEEAFCNNNHELATSLYEQAVSTARKHHFINDEALACELAGYYFLETGEQDTAIQYFLQAHEKYHEWGAVAKSNMLFEFVQRNMSLSIIPSASDLNGVSSFIANGQSSSDDKNCRKRGIG